MTGLRIGSNQICYRLGLTQVQLSMKMKDIALYLGTTPETLSRKFKLLEKMGYLKRTGKQVKILDEDGLLDL